MIQIIYAPNGMDERTEANVRALTESTYLLKNTYRNLNGHLIRGEFSDAFQAAKYVDEKNRDDSGERMGFCLDTGVCNICGQNIYDFIVTLGNRIKAVIIRENDGKTDSSMAPFFYSPVWKSQTDWPGLIRGLRKIDFDGVLIFDYQHSTSAFPWHLRPQLDKLVHAVGEYFKWQIEQEKVLKKYNTRVLFGGGKMFLNYMRYYGEKYPPLFTCDNNRSLWGTQKEGIEVKKPEDLKNIPADCAIFICNIYYREIEEQLRDMGIQNKIEYFNDEVLPLCRCDMSDVERK
ncbi:MAG: sugar phosphate isomerase/epimerase [Lachnospiraceae bacterium]|nr:sugar phosphate isomerase/epimerase [Lachnospiraceae bacterium]